MSKTVLYFGNIDMENSRNKVFSLGLKRNGVEVHTCTSTAKGLKKFWRLYKKHKEFRDKYSALIVGYGGRITVPLAKLISDKPVIFDALCSYYETEILSRDALKEYPFRNARVRFVDWVSTKFADKVLVETQKQKEYFIEKLKVPEEKLVVVYTGVDDTTFVLDSGVEKFEKFTVLFRGRIMIEAGVPTVVRAAKLLEDEDIHFLILGYGHDRANKEFQESLEKEDPGNLEVIDWHVRFDELVEYTQRSHISLGQFADHERLKRTVPHKAYEAMVMKLPYITARTEGISEILEDGKHCLMTNPEDAEGLAQQIKKLYEDQSLREKLSEESRALYEQKFTPKEIVKPLLEIL